jgi:O-acetyl-ADP-ribose deacetylase (regulator of RNase III)
MTTAGDLPAEHVIHTVGPVWHGGTRGEAEQLASCYSTCLELAASRRMTSIAFPAISTGIYGYPKKKAASVVGRVLGRHILEYEHPGVIYLVFFSGDDARLYLETAGCP